MLRNTTQSYGVVCRALHWSIALFIIALIIVGSIMGDLPNAPFKYQVYGLHKSLGITVLMLTVVRVLWWLREVKPAMEKTIPAVWVPVIEFGHSFLYAFMVALPLTGWIMSNAAGYPVSVFGLVTMPTLVAPDKELAHAFKELHELLANSLMMLLFLHVGAALVHHFIYKDRTLKKMVGR